MSGGEKLTAKTGILISLMYNAGNRIESVDGPSSTSKEITVTVLSGYTVLG